MMEREVIKIKRRKMVIIFSRNVQLFSPLHLNIIFACVADELTNLFKYFSHASLFSLVLLQYTLHCLL